MRFVDDKNNDVRFDESFNVIKDKDSPIRNLGKGEKPASFSYYPETVISSDDLFQLKVNTKGVGSFLFAFIFKKLDRERLVDKIYSLKKLEVTDKDSAKAKVEKLRDIVKEFSPVFVVYSDPDVYAITVEEAKEIFSDMKFFYVSNEEEVVEDAPVVEEAEVKEESAADTEVVEVVEATEEEKPAEETVDEAAVEEKTEEVPEEKPVEEEKVEEKPAEEKKEKPAKEHTFFKKVGKFFKDSGLIIKKDKFNFIFALVAAFLIGFTLGVGIYNAYLGKYICIFFFVSTLVGMALNSFVYRDTLVDHKIKSLHILLNVITSVIGLGLSIGGYYLFVYITKEKANPAPALITIIAIQIGCMLASFGIAMLLTKLEKKKKQKKESSAS